MTDDNEIKLSDTISEIRGLITEIKNDMLNPIHKKLCKMGKIDKNEIESLKKILRNMLII